MRKTNLLLLLSLVLLTVSCQKKSSSTSSAATYSETAPIRPDIPVTVPDIPVDTEEYSPRGLSAKVISRSGINHAPMDLLSQALVMTFDPDSQSVKGKSVIKFRLKKPGRPYFELKATPKSVQLDSVSVTASSVTDPDGQNQSYWSLGKELSPNEIHEVTFDYTLPTGRVSFVNDGVRFLTDMTDLSGKFFEYWGPVGFEEDGFALNLSLRIENSSSEHMLKTNGQVTASEEGSWDVSFPAYFSKSSFYVHLTNQTDLPSKSFVYKGLERDIPVEVYGLTTTLVNSAVSQLPKLFAELERDYGPYAHDKFLAYMNDRSGGMEYVGATITSLGSLDHELLHSWFARGVIPADGRSGWIDEAMASWRDYGYSTSSSLLKRTPTNLADYSPFRKTTPSNGYVDGRALMAELDHVFDSVGGLKTVMKAFFEKYKYKVVTNEELWAFLEDFTKIDLQAFNERYALGRSVTMPDDLAEEIPEDPSEITIPESKHPTPLTEEEVLRLR